MYIVRRRVRRSAHVQYGFQGFRRAPARWRSSFHRRQTNARQPPALRLYSVAGVSAIGNQWQRGRGRINVRCDSTPYATAARTRVSRTNK